MNSKCNRRLVGMCSQVEKMLTSFLLFDAGAIRPQMDASCPWCPCWVKQFHRIAYWTSVAHAAKSSTPMPEAIIERPEREIVHAMSIGRSGIFLAQLAKRKYSIGNCIWILAKIATKLPSVGCCVGKRCSCVRFGAISHNNERIKSNGNGQDKL